jgi:hypothetical protein
MAWMWWLLAPVGSTLLGAVWLWRPTLPARARRRWRPAAPMAEHADPDRTAASNVVLLPGPSARSNSATDPLTDSAASAS